MCFWITLAGSKESKYHILRQYWYTRNVPVKEYQCYSFQKHSSKTFLRYHHASHKGDFATDNILLFHMDRSCRLPPPPHCTLFTITGMCHNLWFRVVFFSTLPGQLVWKPCCHAYIEMMRILKAYTVCVSENATVFYYFFLRNLHKILVKGYNNMIDIKNVFHKIFILVQKLWQILFVLYLQNWRHWVNSTKWQD